MPGGQHAAPITDPEELELWNSVLANQNQPFTTSGRGSRPGIPFTYSIRKTLVTGTVKEMLQYYENITHDFRYDSLTLTPCIC